ncbi:MAG TPA: hypothetical protein VFB38_19495 [Chthonomonadaceae bacterium]|jgi:hypothetical protein|nr:hypothetical protein [Chthonomonadaceae bacterium]
MPDAFVSLRRGEKRPLYGQETMAIGTLTIAASPIPSATLYDASGAAVAGFAGLTASGYDSGAQAAPRVWLNLDTSGLAAGFYTLVFNFTATASDGLTRVYMPCLELQVVDVTA